MKNALIGHTGFIGSNLKDMFKFDDFYNSKNIDDIKNKEYDTIFSAGNSGYKWKVTLNPEEDFDNIKRFIKTIDTVKVRKFVLISSIDVYSNPYGVDEDTVVDKNDKLLYGRNRLYLEEFVKKRFEDHLIIRVPIIYGNYFKKNVIYDLLNNHELHKINTNSLLQIYFASNLKQHIDIALENNLKVINLAVEPIWITDIANNIFGMDMEKDLSRDEFLYDMKSKHYKLFGGENGYIQTKEEVMDEITNFKNNYSK